MKTIALAIPMLGVAALVSAQMTSKQKSAEPSVVTDAEVQWGSLNPARGDKAPKAANLWGDRTKEEATGFLVEFRDGFSSPPHIHNVTYRGVVLEGLVHNDDPNAEKMWMPPGSFWTQPAGEVHITAAKGKSLAYIEIDSGPYLVQPKEEAFDKGERPVNIDASNIVWLNASESEWIDNESEKSAQVSYLWGSPNNGESYGAFIKLPAAYQGVISSSGSEFRAVVIKGSLDYQRGASGEQKELSARNYFGATAVVDHQVQAKEETLIYVRSNAAFELSSAK